MRMIDADILVQDTIQEYARSKQYRNAIIRMVNKAPTVEPKRGEWIYGIDEETGEEDCYPWTCSVCKEKYPWQPNFCPNCGADMRKESE